MIFNKFWLYSAPQALEGLIIAIDAYTATTNISLMLAKNLKKIIIVNEANFKRARQLYPNSLLAGESLSLPAETFAVSNMTSEVAGVDWQDKIVLYMTCNGTRVLEKYGGKNRLICCAFNNLGATARWIETEREKKEKVNIIMAGDGMKEVSEDKICADILEKELSGQPYDWNKSAKTARDFIMDYYRSINWKENLKLVFGLNTIDIIGECIVGEKGFLEIISVPVA